MIWNRLQWRYWRDVFRRRDLERDMDEELRAHIVLETQQRIDRGESPVEARTSALRDLGSLDMVKEASRDAWTWQGIDRLVQDLRFACRQFRKNPGFTISATLILGVGIGATSAIFTVVNTIIVKPLAYRDSGRLVSIQEKGIPGPLPVNAMHFNTWRESTHAFEAMALIGGTSMNLTGSGEPERLPAARVSPALFPMLGVQPASGRLLRSEEDVPGRDHVVVIANDLWKRKFGATPDMIGKTITLDGDAYEVVGVLPESFRFPKLSQLYAITVAGFRPQVWKPFALRRDEMDAIGDFNFICIARVAPGTSLAESRSELDVMMQRIRSQFPLQLSGLGAVMSPLQDQMVGRSRIGLELLFAAVSVVLLGACVNVTNLLLARTSTRRREIGIRAAIGASRGRLTRQVLAESLLLSGLGGVFGIAVAYATIAMILRMAPADIPRLDELHPDIPMFLSALGLSILTGCVIGLLPALRFTSADLNQAMASSSRTATASTQTGRLRSMLVSVEVGLTVVCLIASGLLLRSFVNLLTVDRGFETDRILTADIAFSETRYPGLDKKSEFLKTALEQLQTLPGVTSVGVVNRLPLNGSGGNNGMIPEGMVTTEHPIVDIRTVNPDYLRTMGIVLYEGRTFDERDRARNVAMISKSTAERIWAGQNPVGKRFRFGSPDRPPIEVIGVAADIRGVSLDRAPELTAYVPYWQGSFGIRAVTIVVKANREPAAVSAAIRTTVRNIDADMPLPPFRTMDQVVEQSVGERRFQLDLILLFGLIAVVLAGLGIFGTMSYRVAQRTNEVGIRIALGAPPRSIAARIVVDALKSVAIGLLTGFPIALAATAALRSLLFGVTPRDPLTLIATCAIITMTAILAAFVPARRASRIDPILALREE
jgi:putative ABC transport system permease protein